MVTRWAVQLSFQGKGEIGSCLGCARSRLLPTSPAPPHSTPPPTGGDHGQLTGFSLVCFLCPLRHGLQVSVSRHRTIATAAAAPPRSNLLASCRDLIAPPSTFLGPSRSRRWTTSARTSPRSPRSRGPKGAPSLAPSSS